jgi:Stage II sporulation protein E (SpoIIE)
MNGFLGIRSLCYAPWLFKRFDEEEADGRHVLHHRVGRQFSLAEQLRLILARSIANIEGDPLLLARQINEHLLRYTPTDRFATAVFIVLSRDSGELTYVNAGHNAPIVFCSGATTVLEATGIPLGLLSAVEYKAGSAAVPPGGTLLLFTDGLTDSIAGDAPQDRLCAGLVDDPTTTMFNLKSLVDPRLNEDDVTILLVKRATGVLGGVPE